jgi:hypothetical protein
LRSVARDVGGNVELALKRHDRDAGGKNEERDQCLEQGGAALP